LFDKAADTLPQRRADMRFLMMIKAAETSEPPTPELIAAVGKLAREMERSGTLLDSGGLAPSAAGARIRLNGAKLVVTDGPFAETHEVIGGYAILRAHSKREAIELGTRFIQLHADILGSSYRAECEVREMFDSPAALEGVTTCAIHESSPGQY